MTFTSSRYRTRFTALPYGVLVVIVFGILTIGSSARAADAQTVADAQCVVIGARLYASSDQRQRASGQILLVYFLGRIQGRSPNVDLEVLIDHEAKAMAASDLEEAMRRCGTELSTQGAEISKIGKHLSQLGN
jgi:hypothetical protein